MAFDDISNLLQRGVSRPGQCPAFLGGETSSHLTQVCSERFSQTNLISSTKFLIYLHGTKMLTPTASPSEMSINLEKTSCSSDITYNS